MNLRSQNLEKHLWNDRVLLIITSSLENSGFEKQMVELNSNLKALEERKLVVYQITPQAYRTIIPEKSEWSNNLKLSKRFSSSEHSFKIVLIGLDGGVKLEQNTFLSTKKLFNKIDAMPMRRSKIKNKQP